MDIIDMIHNSTLELWGYQLTDWHRNLFTVRWWLIIGSIAIAYGIWWKYVNKRYLTQILLFGSFIAVFRLIMDDAGSSAALWSYSVKPLPFGQALFLNDLTIVPLGFMLVYQYCQSWKKFFLWIVIVEAGYSFFLLPILVKFDILRLYNWQYYYTFFIMIIVAIVMRAMILIVLKIEQKYEFGYSSNSLTTKMHPVLKPLNQEDKRRKD
ncbi:CBO0543 family protein [Pelosinus propionicus]|uniref:Uncharacterized protein n=1 Tax=Pelosinus propionicus DSM 13327 TaxID=1123291 RepID=A0A1I4HK81_9FIRM|nr:CBO0543 family protein [Pelosinus propionicus]SFL42107.1 hypothetical protein SAMN04490355_100425 [Pelosinus propionicus DSM 13327]